MNSKLSCNWDSDINVFLLNVIFSTLNLFTITMISSKSFVNKFFYTITHQTKTAVINFTAV